MDEGSNRVASPPNGWWWIPGGLYAGVVVGSLVVGAWGVARAASPYDVGPRVSGISTVVAWVVFVAVAWMDVEAVRAEEARRDRDGGT